MEPCTDLFFGAAVKALPSHFGVMLEACANARRDASLLARNMTMRSIAGHSGPSAGAQNVAWTLPSCLSPLRP